MNVNANQTDDRQKGTTPPVSRRERWRRRFINLLALIGLLYLLSPVLKLSGLLMMLMGLSSQYGRPFRPEQKFVSLPEATQTCGFRVFYPSFLPKGFRVRRMFLQPRSELPRWDPKFRQQALFIYIVDEWGRERVTITQTRAWSQRPTSAPIFRGSKELQLRGRTAYLTPPVWRGSGKVWLAWIEAGTEIDVSEWYRDKPRYDIIPVAIALAAVKRPG